MAAGPRGLSTRRASGFNSKSLDEPTNESLLPAMVARFRCNQRRTGRVRGAVRFRSWQPASCLHPTIRAHTPLVFDLVDVAAGRSIAGCKYHIEHPGGSIRMSFR